MNERNRKVVRATNYLMTGNRESRTTRIAGAVIGKVLDQEGGKLTGRVIIAILVVLGVVGLAFVAYRLLVLDLIMNVVQERG